jgi:hypothetical protein
MRLRPSPSMAVSLAALVVALGGTSYAAAMINSQDVVDDSLRSVDIRNDTVRSLDVRDSSLRAKDFRAGSIPAGEQGPAGPTGPTGPAGPQGPAGADSTDRWFLVNAAGAIVAQSGGFEVDAAYPVLDNTAPAGSPSNAMRANGNVYVETNEDLSNNGIVATIALQNATDQNNDAITNGRAPGPDANPEFSGEIAVGQCGTAGFVACAPPGTNTSEYVVISPRNSDGSVTTDGQRKRFYVIITGDSTDYVAPTAP